MSKINETKIILSKPSINVFLSIIDLLSNTAPSERVIRNPTVNPDGLDSPDNNEKSNPHIARNILINMIMVRNLNLVFPKSINNLIGIASAIVKFDDNANGPSNQTLLKLSKIDRLSPIPKSFSTEKQIVGRINRKIK